MARKYNMKISEKLPQFKGETALFLVTGKQDAIIYKARDGELTKLVEINIPRPRYSDHEAHFEKRGHGKLLFTGSAYEYQDYKVIKEFLAELIKRLKSLKEAREAGKFFLFTPPYVKSEIRNSFPRELKNKIKVVISGNYIHSHPTELLEKISKRQ